MFEATSCDEADESALEYDARSSSVHVAKPPTSALPRVVACGLVLMRQETTKIKGLSLVARAGEVVGIVGDEASGTSSCLALLTGRQTAESGVLQICGTIYRDTPPSHVVGTNDVVPPDNDWQTGHDWLSGMAVRAGLPPAEAADHARACLVQVGLDALADIVLARYPAAERKVLSIAAASVGPPPVVALSEPATQLPMRLHTAVINHVLRMRAAGTTIIVALNCTNVAAIAFDRLYVLHRGTVVARGTLSDLRAAAVLRARREEAADES